MSTVFHLQMDRATKCSIWSIGQILRGVVKSDQTNWIDKIPLVKFAMYSIASATTGFALFELNGAMLRMMKRVDKLTELQEVQAFAQRVKDNVLQVHDVILESQVLQTYHANKHRHPEHHQ